MTTSLQKITAESAAALDHAIDEAMRHFVELGALLIEMRDSRKFLKLPNPFKPGMNFETFEEYTSAKREIGKQMATRIIRASLTQRALDGVADSATRLLPTGEFQVRVLAENVVEFETEDRPQPQGGFVRYPVGVLNVNELGEVWDRVADKYEKVHDANPLRKLSASFIYDAMPRKYQRGPSPKVKIKDPRLIGRVQRNGQKFLELMGWPDKWTLEEIKDAAVKESWNADDIAGLRDVLKDVDEYVSDFRSQLAKYRVP